MTIRLNGSTSGYVEIDAPAVAGTGALTLPTGTGTIAKTTDQGLVHINTTAFTTQSAVSVNDVFTSTYDNYKIILFNTNSAATNINIRLRAAGSDASGANYTHYIFRGSGGATLSQLTSTGTEQQLDPVGGVGPKYSLTEVFNPNLAVVTGIQTLATNLSTNGVGIIGGNHDLTNAYDGFTLFPSSGTITGTVRVYGYKNS
jgi:hypothetical protein